MDPGIDYLVKRTLAQSDPAYWAQLFEELPTLRDPDSVQDTYTILADTQNRYLVQRGALQ